MPAFLLYILKSIVISAILFSYYWFALRNKAFHTYNRFYLLAIVMLSLFLPLISIRVPETTEHYSAIITIFNQVNASDRYITENISFPEDAHGITTTGVISFIYILVCIVFLLLLAQMLFKIYCLLHRYRSYKAGGMLFINTSGEHGTPFSFFRYIFWNSYIDMHTDTGKRIFRHELAHARQKHSHDKLFINMVMALFWANPILWLIRRELSMIHEFTADKAAVQDGDMSAFAEMVLAAAYPQKRMALTNHFFYSPIKRRLMMITKNNDPKRNYIRRLLVLPLAGILFAAFTLKTNTLISPLQLREETRVIRIPVSPVNTVQLPGEPNPDSLGMYNGKKIIGMSMTNRSEKIKLILEDNTTVWITKKEMKRLNIKLPPPPPAPPVPPVSPGPDVPPVPPTAPMAPPPPPPPPTPTNRKDVAPVAAVRPVPDIAPVPALSANPAPRAKVRE